MTTHRLALRPSLGLCPTAIRAVSWILTLAVAICGLPRSTAAQDTSPFQATILNAKSLSLVIDPGIRFLGSVEQPIALRSILGIDRSLVIRELSEDNRFVLINPHRMLFEEYGFIDTGEFLATTLQLYGRREAKADISASTVHVSEHGYIALMTPGLATEGIIVATVSTAASNPEEKIVLDLMSDGLLQYAIGQSELELLTGVDGKALAKASAERGARETGQMLINARSAADIQRSAVNSNNISRAHRLVVENGSVLLEPEHQMTARGKSERLHALDQTDTQNMGHNGRDLNIPEAETTSAATVNASDMNSSHDAALSADNRQTRLGSAPLLSGRNADRARTLAKKPLASSSEPALKESRRAGHNTGANGKGKTYKTSPHRRAFQPSYAPPIASQGGLPEWMKYLPKTESAPENAALP